MNMATSEASALRPYEVIACISGKMLERARTNEWTEVIELGKKYYEAVEALRDIPPLTTSERLARKALLAKILEDDARIRNLAMPELARLGAMIGNIKRHQSVLEAYCAPARSEM